MWYMCIYTYVGFYLERDRIEIKKKTKQNKAK